MSWANWRWKSYNLSRLGWRPGCALNNWRTWKSPIRPTPLLLDWLAANWYANLALWRLLHSGERCTNHAAPNGNAAPTTELAANGPRRSSIYEYRTVISFVSQ